VGEAVFAKPRRTLALDPAAPRCAPAAPPQELILFSRADLERSIPCLVDGLKPGQRKILYCAFKRNLKKDIKVGGLGGMAHIRKDRV
jgi:hypothetical protein